MLTKGNVIKTISNFPDSFALAGLVEKLIFTDKVERGFGQSVNNKVSTYDDAKKKLEKWLK